MEKIAAHGGADSQLGVALQGGVAGFYTAADSITGCVLDAVGPFRALIVVTIRTVGVAGIAEVDGGNRIAIGVGQNVDTGPGGQAALNGCGVRLAALAVRTFVGRPRVARDPAHAGPIVSGLLEHRHTLVGLIAAL